MSAARYPPLAGFLIAPEHSASEGTSMRCCDWEEGASGCWSCLPGTAGWDLWGMEPWCLAHTPESTLFPPCTCRREPPAKVARYCFWNMKGWHMLGWLIQDAMRLHRKNERFAKITHLATGYTSKYQHQKFPTLTSVNSMDRKDYHAPSAIFEKKNNQLRVFTQSLDYARHEDPTSFQKSRNQQLQNFFLFSFLEYAGELRIIALRENRGGGQPKN